MTVSDQRVRHAGTGSRPTESTVDEFVERLITAALGAQEVQAVYLGDRLGWYRALAELGPCTSTELAAATGTAERYAREWLEQQAVVGYLAVDDIDAEASERRYVLLAAQAEVLTDEDSPYLTSLFTANASSGVATRMTDSTGPKISSCSRRLPGSTRAKIVGSKKNPSASALPSGRRPPHRRSAPSA